MPDLEKMTLQRLRELARKTLGPGQARLKTKAALVEALRAAGEGSAAVRPAGAPARAAGTRSPGARAKAGPAGKGAGKAAGTGRAAKAPAAGAAKGAAKPARKAAAKPAAPEAAKGGARGTGRRAAAEQAVPAQQPRGAGWRGEGLPDPEGYFVARVRGEDAVREAPHPLSESGADVPWPADAEGVGVPTYDEGLGDLPWGYGDDAFVALPRDPTTLFLYWDLAGETVARGFEGLEGARAQLWIFAQRDGGWDRLRTVEFALESRGWYLHDLEPGRTYRAEIHAVGARGEERLVGRSSNAASLPPVGPSPIVDDRFARIPWDMPLGRLLGPGRPGGPFSDEARALLARLSDWSRFQGATWGSAGGMGGRPFSPTSSPGGKPGPRGGGEER